MAPPTTKKVTKRTNKPVHLSVAQKLSLIKKLEDGKSVAHVCEEYGVKKQTVSDIRKSKEKLQSYAVKFSVSGTEKSVTGRKHMKTSSNVDLDAAVYKWYVQQRSCRVSVRGVEIASSAAKLAAHMGIADLKASDGWLWRFRKRHGIHNVKETGEAASAEVESVEPFRLKLLDLIKSEDLSMSQIYNVDETGVMWRSLPKNTQARQDEHKVPGKKVNKERLSVMCGANASGTHRLKLAIVGKSAKPRALKDYFNRLPVHYYNSKKAWFNSWICTDWFKKHLVPEIRNYQERIAKIVPAAVKALVLLDNAPAHPSHDVLQSDDGKIKCMFLPKNTTSLIQPMDQGVISAFKRRYVRKYLDEVLVVLQNEADLLEDTRGKRTLQNIKSYTIRSAIYNMADVWADLKHSTLANAWKKLIKDEDFDINFEGFEAADFHALLHRAGENDVTVDDVHEWIDENEAADGHEILSDEQIVAAVTTTGEQSDSEDSDVEMEPTVNISVIKEHADELFQFVANSSDSDIQEHYDQLRILRAKLNVLQHRVGRQSKIDSYFQPKTTKPRSPQPGPSGMSSSATTTSPAPHDFSGFPDSPIAIESDLE